jgi:hypothetical protein
MRTALLLLLALAAPLLSGTVSAREVWKWIDEKGIPHYSDQPVPGATRIEVSTGNAAQSQSAPQPSSDESSGMRASPGDAYRTFEITQPQNDQVFINNTGQVDVQIRVDPQPQAGHSLHLYLDGRLVQEYSGGTSYTLQNLPRGTHSVVATINDPRGTRVRETSPVMFTVRQESIAQPPVGPSLRPPPPKPQPRASNKVLTTQPSYGALHNTPAAIDPATNLPVVKKPAPKPGKP